MVFTSHYVNQHHFVLQPNLVRLSHIVRRPHHVRLFHHVRLPHHVSLPHPVVMLHHVSMPHLVSLPQTVRLSLLLNRNCQFTSICSAFTTGGSSILGIWFLGVPAVPLDISMSEKKPIKIQLEKNWPNLDGQEGN